MATSISKPETDRLWVVQAICPGGHAKHRILFKRSELTPDQARLNLEQRLADQIATGATTNHCDICGPAARNWEIQVGPAPTWMIAWLEPEIRAILAAARSNNRKTPGR